MWECSRGGGSNGNGGCRDGGAANTLFYGDNLDVLRESVASESVDLIYLDPAFNSNATYNVLFRAPAGLFVTSFGRNPKIQIVTVRELLAGVRTDLPALGLGEGFRRAPRERVPGAEKIGMDL